MKKLIIKILLLLCSFQAFGTAQIPDILIYKGDTISLFDCPLFYYPNKELIKPQSLFGSSGCFYTACYRNYVATWVIEDNKLYLISIRNACYPTDMKYVAASYKNGVTTPGTEFADLKTLFPERFENGRVLADWVDKKVISPVGKILFYLNDGYASVFEKEIELTIEKGILTSAHEFDNSKTHQSKYTKNPDLIKEFIQSNIEYSGLKRTDSVIKVMVVVFGANDERKIDSLKIFKGYKEDYDREAIRVVKSIPEWDVIYRHGERSRGYPWLIPVIFDRKR